MDLDKMDNFVKGLFAVAAALCFLAFSPLNEPGGTTVAIIGAALSGATAIIFFFLGTREE